MENFKLLFQILFSPTDGDERNHRQRQLGFRGCGDAAFGWKKFAAAEWFLKNGADVNASDEKGNTALFYAVKMRQKYEEKDIELLLKYGADINKENNEGISPKKLAEMMRRRKVLKLLRTRKKSLTFTQFFGSSRASKTLSVIDSG